MPALRRRLEAIARLPVRPEIHAVVTVGDEAYKD
jgi:ferric-chelate reductase (NADPH)